MEPEVREVTRSGSGYPESLTTVLGNKAPEKLYLQGNVNLLRSTGIGFSGTRNPSQGGIDTVQDCAKKIAGNSEFTVISGNAAGVDLEAHYHALSAGGSTILVLPEGINHFRIRRGLKRVWDWERVLVISQFNPGAGWKVYQAMARNQMIIGLSKAVIVIEAGEKGGTRHAGEEAIRCNKLLYVAEYDDMPADAKGNKELLAKGGRSLPRSEPSGQANMQKVYEDIKVYEDVKVCEDIEGQMRMVQGKLL